MGLLKEMLIDKSFEGEVQCMCMCTVGGVLQPVVSKYSFMCMQLAYRNC